MADAIEERKLKKVGVLEFINDTKLSELLGADFGLLGRYCAEELERKFASNRGSKPILPDTVENRSFERLCRAESRPP